MKQSRQILFLFFILLFGLSCSDDHSSDPEVVTPQEEDTLRYFVSVLDTEEMTPADLLTKMDADKVYASLLPNVTIRSTAITYHTKDAKGNDVIASGIVTYPVNITSKGTIVGMHYTITKNDEAPSSMMCTIESALSFYGYTVISPDYLGYGTTADLPHPYLHAKLTGESTSDFVFAVREYMDSVSVTTPDSLYVVGYSEGGGAAVAFQKTAEENYPKELPIIRVMAGGGVYSPQITTDTLIARNFTDYAASIPMSIIGLDYGDQLHLDFGQLFLDPLRSNYNDWIGSKNYTSGEINRLIGTDKLSEILSADFFTMNSDNADLKKLYASLKSNTLLEWTPRAPILLVASKADNIVPFVNSQMAYDTFKAKGCDVELISLKSGSHYEAAVTFYLKVLSLLGK